MGTFHKNALPTGHSVAEYTIESVLGHGGFGITYLARDTTLGALVAIKEFLPGEIAQRDAKMNVLPNPDRQAVRDYQAGLKNFVKEARSLAYFKHPHIVRVLRFLESNGTAYVVMEYEEGQSLADYLKVNGPRLDEPMALRTFIPFLNGLHAVHEAKMLHLDIKPDNIYLRKDGSPMLIDFGSARRAMTESNAGQRIALTIGYAPIEQYPDKGQQGPWTDIYALGASMYRCVTGKRPDDALTRYQAVLKYQTDPLVPATKLGDRRYQGMLLECIDWAMQIYAKDRPQTAREMQDGLMGKRRQAAAAASAPMRYSPAPTPRPAVPVAARARMQMRERFRYRLRVLFGMSRMLFLMVVVGGGLIAASFYWNDIKQWLTPSVDIPREAPVEKPASDAGTANDAASSTAANDKNVAKPANRPTASLPATALVRTLTGHTDWVQAVSFSADGKWVASASTDRSIRVWNLADGALLGTLKGHTGAVNALAYSADGKWLASGSDDGTVRLWDSYSGGQRNILRGLGGTIFALSFSPDSKLIAAAGRDRTVYVWEAASGKRVAALDGHKNDIFALAFAPNSTILASAGADKTLRIWNVQTGEEVSVSAGHKDAVLSLAFAPNGRWLVSGDAGHSLRMWDGETYNFVRVLSGVDQPVLALAVSPDSRWIAAGLADNSVDVFDANDHDLTATLTGHQDQVQAVAFSPDSRWLASGSRDRSVKLWSGAQPR
jgi:WD40 repeat protein